MVRAGAWGEQLSLAICVITQYITLVIFIAVYSDDHKGVSALPSALVNNRV